MLEMTCVDAVGAIEISQGERNSACGAPSTFVRFHCRAQVLRYLG
jgi:hypothetical protein